MLRRPAAKTSLLRARVAVKATGFDPINKKAPPEEDLAAVAWGVPGGGEPTPLHRILRISAVGNISRSSFMLEMGGQKILVNPRFEKGGVLEPSEVHKVVDKVVITTGDKEFCDMSTFSQFNLMRTSFVADMKATEALQSTWAPNIDTLAAGPDGYCILAGKNGAANIMIMAVPGTPAPPLPWIQPEIGMIFINMVTGIAVAYEAKGNFCGQGGESKAQGIPAEAYQIDYLITPNFREAADVVRSLTIKGAQIRGVVRLPDTRKQMEIEGAAIALVELDLRIDAALGGIGNNPTEFTEWLQKQGPKLAQIKAITVPPGGDPVELET